MHYGYASELYDGRVAPCDLFGDDPCRSGRRGGARLGGEEPVVALYFVLPGAEGDVDGAGMLPGGEEVGGGEWGVGGDDAEVVDNLVSGEW